MITCDLLGGLGNQLFQIFTTISYALKSKKEFYFSDQKIVYAGENTTIRYTYWDSFLKELKPFLKDENTLQMFKKYKLEESILKNNNMPVVVNIPSDIIIQLFGFFQSYKYFQEYYKSIYNLLKIDEQKKEVLHKINKDELYFKNMTSLHFRRGDYKKYLDVHPIMDDEYYIKSIEYILKNSKTDNLKIMYFCEDEDVDTVNETISKLSFIFKNSTFERCINTLTDWEQLLIMSICQYNIIANSSYSWWGAYLSNANDTEKIICYPSLWFTNKVDKDITDMFPNNWIKI